MDLHFTFVVIDGRTTLGDWHEIDMTAALGYNADKTELNSTRSAKPATSRVFLSFLQDTPNIVIYEEMEVWAGWRDRDTGRWYDYPDVPNRIYGGYILKIDKSYTEGADKKMELTLIDYMHDPTSIQVRSWPNPETDPVPQGYPPGYSVRDWLVGTRAEGRPFDGILPVHMKGDEGVRFDGVDSIFTQIIFNEDTLPGIIEVGTAFTTGIDGRFGVLMLDKVITAIADAAGWTWAKNYSQGGQDMRVAWWMEAAISPADPSKIVPRFRLANQADVGQADWTVATDASPDPALHEYAPIRDAYHARDATGRMDIVLVRGIGFDETIPGSPLPVEAIAMDPRHQTQYPTRYAAVPGRATEIIFDARIHTRALAQLVANRLEQILWGARGAITFDCLAPIAQGDFVHYRNPNEAIDQVYPCTDSTIVAGFAGSPHYRVTIGFNPQTLQDLLKGGLIDSLLNAQDLLFKTGQWPQRTAPGNPPQIPPEMTPTHPQRNKIQALFTDTPGIAVKGSTRARPVPQGSPAAPVAGTFQASGPDDKVRSWTDQNGVHHPIGVRMLFTAAGTKYWVAESDYVRMDSLLAERSGVGTETISFTKNGVGVSAPFAGSQGDRIGVAATGVVGGTPLALIVREQDAP